MITLTREELKALLKVCDNNNPKFELNFIFIDKENSVSTNTRALCIVKHSALSNTTNDMHLHNSLATAALKQTKAVSFTIEESNKITALDKDDLELMTFGFSSKSDYLDKDFRYPDYSRIIPESFKSVIPFTLKEQIQGVLALNEITVNQKYIPDFNAGLISHNGPDSPVHFEEEFNKIIYISMPIKDDRFKELKNYMMTK